MPGDPLPKDRFTSLDTLAVARELRALGPARVDKAFDLVAGGWSLTLRSVRSGKLELVLVPGRYAVLVEEGPRRAEELTPFAKDLRRLLSGAALRSVSEPQGERFLELGLARTDEPGEILVALEMFGSGNLTVARDGKILAVATARRWAHRVVRPGAPYSRPPQRADPWAATLATVEGELSRSRTDLASTVAARLAFGGPVAEELLARAGLAPDAPASPRPHDAAVRLMEAIGAILSEVGDRPAGHLYRRDGSLVDATPYRSRRWELLEGVEAERRPTFSESAFEYFRALQPELPSEEERAAEAARRELDRQIEQQEAAIVALGREIEERKADAQAIFDHYREAEEIVAKAGAAGRSAERVAAVLGERTVQLRADRTPRESAQEWFEEGKRLGAKLKGATAALADARARRERPSTQRPARPRAADGGPAGKPFWFERYRWFLTSDRTIVIAGRDAASNDLIVRKNLKDGDRYLHADLRGASSVIVKRREDGGSISDAAIREAGQWAVAFSKAWRAGLASASAFWVTPDQVSKQAATGEFVPKGAWVIHGTKNVLKDLPLELAVGPVRHDGVERWTAAPPESVRALGDVRVLLTPGDDRERAAREVELSKELGLSRSFLQSVLPAGGLTIRRP